MRRNADDELYSCLVAGEFCYVLDARQIGKSSLMVSTASRLREAGVTSVILDLTSIGQNLTVEQWYFGMLVTVASQTATEDDAIEYWDQHVALGPMQRMMHCIRDVILPRASRPLVIFVDEIDSVRSLRFSSDEFFAGIRECYNRRTEHPAYKALTFCLLGVATPDDLIRNPNTTPFNIGKRITLGDFDRDEARFLATGLGDERVAQQLLNRIFYWTDGHPYLTQRLCKAVSENPGERTPGLVDDLCNKLFLSQEGKEHDDNLLFVKHRLLSGSTDTVRVLELYSRVLRGSVSVRAESPELLFDLLLSGAVKAADGTMRVRNRLYGQVFNEAWVRGNTPEAERKRQRNAFHRGLLRTASVLGIFCLILGFVVLWALRQASLAREQQKVAAERSSAYKHLLYQSRIGQAQRLLSSDPPRIEAAMQILRPYEAPGNTEELRGFEWGYLWRQAHPYTDQLYRGSAGTIGVSALMDAETFAEISADRVAIWSMRESKVTQSFSVGPNDPSVAPAFSPKLGAVAFAMEGGAIGFYRIATQSFQRFDGVPKLKLLKFSRDGSHLLALGTVGTGSIRDLSRNTVTAVRAPDGAISATAISTGFLVLAAHQLSRLSFDGKETSLPVTISAAAVSVAVNADEQRILLTFRNGGLTLLDGRSFGKLQSFETRLSDLVSGDFAGSDRVFGIARNGMVRVWRYDHGTSYWSGRESLGSPVASLAPKGTRLLEADEQGFVEVYDLGPRADVQSYSSPVKAVSVTPNGNMVYVTQGPSTRPTVLYDSARLDSPFVAIGFARGKSVSAEALFDGRVRIKRDNLVLHELKVTEKLISLCPSQDGSRLLTLDSSGTARLLSCTSGATLTSLPHVTGEPGMDATGDRVFAISQGVVHLWSGGTWRVLEAARGASAADLHPAGRYLAFVLDSSLHVLDLANGADSFVSSRADRNSKATRLLYSPVGNRLAEGAEDGSVRLLDSTSGETVMELPTSRQDGAITTLAFADDGSLLVSATSTGKLRLYPGFNLKLADGMEDFQSKLVRSAAPAGRG